jgi:hypothetical protein
VKVIKIIAWVRKDLIRNKFIEKECNAILGDRRLIRLLKQDDFCEVIKVRITIRKV